MNVLEPIVTRTMTCNEIDTLVDLLQQLADHLLAVRPDDEEPWPSWEETERMLEKSPGGGS